MSVAARPARLLLDGAARVFLAEGLSVPAGLAVAAYLSRRLGPSEYGLFVLAASLVAWAEWSIAALLSRAAVRCVGEAAEWRPAAAGVSRAYARLGIGAMVLVAATAVPAARLLREPALAGYLLLFAAEIPLFALAAAGRDILVGRGLVRRRAGMAAARAAARVILTVALVEAGLSVYGAVLASIGAAGVEALTGRAGSQLRAAVGATGPERRLWAYAGPLLVYTLGVRLFDRLDLLTLKALGATAALAGVYGAAQSLALLPGLFAMALSPLLLAMLTRMTVAGECDAARALARDAMRAVLWLIPVAGLAAGAAPGIVRVVFGPAFAAAAPLFARLMFAALAMAMLSVTTAVLTAAGRLRWTSAVATPMLPAALVGHLLLIPRLGAAGAALVTTFVACAGAAMAVVLVWRAWGVLPPAGSALRSAAACAGAYALAAGWDVPASLLPVKLLAIAATVPLALLALGEFDAGERALARSLVR